ncbi:MAG: 3-oxoacyl-ACP reductase FabG [Anaerolineales bacterium]|nr:3-oxoacyl-ACP reductase FabG [Anaerolineales bacterium]
MRLTNRVALVTGAGSGIGRATARRLAADGAAVVVADLDEVGLSAVAAEISAAGGRAVVAAGSVTERAAVQAMVDAATSRFGRLDILVNNAGINRDGLVVRVKDGEVRAMGDEQWDSVLAVNLKGTFLCAQAAAVPMMAQRSGRIINTASVSALGNIGQANYAASKAGVIGLTKTLALEWARFGILVNAVAPGAVNTRMTAAIPDGIRSALVERIPLKRMAEPEEIAAVHAFLAGDDAGYLTGQVLWVDGGLTAGA